MKDSGGECKLTIFPVNEQNILSQKNAFSYGCSIDYMFEDSVKVEMIAKVMTWEIFVCTIWNCTEFEILVNVTEWMFFS